ncbi:7TM diverse intracellular signaling domain-containing protein [Massilia sp. DJPM01]|uniref:7TM diverse intracellular signaling domain-containing protein n=1 Tax=Massilia sp. DJPM01 TaxID=3024404 RepID=UPI00259E3DEF|nr:7TM diverse intracellular signaling domain-containing protein [Massilia sp. DJPM01]MDM5177260.1 7TM diverse intracellular signaling domain-containing protein [Massilia sp. DJPM01]
MLPSLQVTRHLILFATCVLMCFRAEATNAVGLDTLRLAGDLTGETLGLRFVRDPRQTLTIAQVRTLPEDHFAPVRQRDVNQRLQRGDYWLKTSVHNPSRASIAWVLRHPMPITDYVEYWIFTNGALVAHARGGDRTLVSERQIPYRIASVRHTSDAGQRSEVYIRLRNTQASPMHLTFALSDEAAFLRKMANDQLSMGVFYGIPLALVVYALCGWLINRTRGSLVYAGYVLAVMGSWLGINGQLAEYVFVGRPDIANFMLVIFFLLATIANCLFVREFLQTKRFMPRFDRYFCGVIALALVGIVLRTLGLQVAVVQVTIALVLTHAIAPVLAIVALRGRAVFARWYLLAQLVYSTALIVGIAGVRYAELSYDNYFFYCQLAFIAELVLLGVAQQDRVRILQREKSAFEQKYNTALQLNNAELARQLEQRTGQLREAQQRTAFMASVKTTTGRIANGEFGVRLAPGESPELSELANNVNVMAESLSRLEGARKRWIADISHELRMPLFSLLCETEALLDGVRTINKHAIASIHEEVMRLSRLVSDLHEVALSYLRPLPCTFTSWQLAELLTKKKHAYLRHAQERGLRFTLDVPPGFLLVKWDKGRFEQLLDNLVQNSLSYTDAPGELALSIQAGPERVSITLQDTSPGIGPADAKHLFEPLYRADIARSRRAGGSGLGLSICQAIVHAHHGSISAEPSPMGGLAIHIDLPRSIDKI